MKSHKTSKYFASQADQIQKLYNINDINIVKIRLQMCKFYHVLINKKINIIL